MPIWSHTLAASLTMMQHVPGRVLGLAPNLPLASTVRGVSLFRSLFLVGFGGTLLLLAIRRLRTYKLRERYALLFVLIGLPFLGLAFWPNGVGWLAERLKIQYNTLALIAVSAFLFLMVFELLTIVSTQEQKITTLAQLVGILMEKQKLVEPEHTPGSAMPLVPPTDADSAAHDELIHDGQ